MATPIKSLFPSIEKKPFLLNKQKKREPSPDVVYRQDAWAKVDFKRICNNKEKALINLIHIQEGLVGGTKTITQGLREED